MVTTELKINPTKRINSTPNVIALVLAIAGGTLLVVAEDDPDSWRIFCAGVACIVAAVVIAVIADAMAKSATERAALHQYIRKQISEIDHRIKDLEKSDRKRAQALKNAMIDDLQKRRTI